ncbi:MAG: DUF3997 domain-containing protein [Actinobacteria bacterium]|nr:DUF3997 domain-containing protein [Actinomycetota bacterium]MCL5883174.1 DUF3997 domain-containing protein [Actinomycetota bacterium]
MIKFTLVAVFFFVAVFIVGCNANESYTSLSGKYTYVWDGDANTYIFHELYSRNGKLIPCTVKEYVYDDAFIIASQKPNQNCNLRREDSLRTGNELNYWIADIGRDQLHGPLSYDEYIKMRDKLKVPEILSLKDSN